MPTCSTPSSVGEFEYASIFKYPTDSRSLFSICSNWFSIRSQLLCLCQAARWSVHSIHDRKAYSFVTTDLFNIASSFDSLGRVIMCFHVFSCVFMCFPSVSLFLSFFILFFFFPADISFRFVARSLVFSAFSFFSQFPSFTFHLDFPFHSLIQWDWFFLREHGQRNLTRKVALWVFLRLDDCLL